MKCYCQPAGNVLKYWNRIRIRELDHLLTACIGLHQQPIYQTNAQPSNSRFETVIKRFLDEFESSKFSCEKWKNHDGNSCGKHKLREISELWKETWRIVERKRAKGNGCIFRRDDSNEENLCALPPDPKPSATQMKNSLRMTGNLKRAVHREKASKTAQRVSQWELREALVWYVTISQSYCKFVKSALLCTQRLMVCRSDGRRSVVERVFNAHGINSVCITRKARHISEKKWGRKARRWVWFNALVLMSAIRTSLNLTTSLKKSHQDKSDAPAEKHKLNETQQATFFSSSDNWRLPASSSKLQERKFVVIIGASLHTKEVDASRRCRKSASVVTTTGKCERR